MSKQNGEKVPTIAIQSVAVHDHMTEYPIATVIMAINKIVVAVRDNLRISIRCFDQLDWNLVDNVGCWVCTQAIEEFTALLKENSGIWTTSGVAISIVCLR